MRVIEAHTFLLLTPAKRQWRRDGCGMHYTALEISEVKLIALVAFYFEGGNPVTSRRRLKAFLPHGGFLMAEIDGSTKIEQAEWQGSDTDRIEFKMRTSHIFD